MFSRERRTRLFDGCQAALVWLAVLASVVADREVERLALAAMAAVALAAAFVALCPAAPAPSLRDASPTTREDESHVL
ncbi:hypothetical protein SAMN02927924_04332 [Sphingobium faniae]|uniref:Uncharacterized protein n=1 Tax=Sphingobium wenxiniae (strain DSM 21828 / CGMCC 1.7748 / JZ-1) TaxID=595605 RepID=A0A562KAF6_SPHWJ|nr:hypothetical protein IQ35_02719 [Sphingobium wenxiniae]SCW93404.1 hypothetical protein SAMN02927924_04332 [Sphingobium faniae]